MEGVNEVLGRGKNNPGVSDKGGSLAPPPPARRLQILEAVLFASPGPMTLKDLAEVCPWGDKLLLKDLDRLSESMEGRGIKLQHVAGAWRLVTRPEWAEYVEKMLKTRSKRRLTRAQLETLAVIAYKQPVTRAQIEKYRGVGCERVLGQLQDFDLIRVSGRAQIPGRPLLYVTTERFMEYFALGDLSELPSLEVSEKAEGECQPEAVSEQPLLPLRSKAMDDIADSISAEPSSGLQRIINKLRKRNKQKSKNL